MFWVFDGACRLLGFFLKKRKEKGGKDHTPHIPHESCNSLRDESQRWLGTIPAPLEDHLGPAVGKTGLAERADALWV